MIRGRKELENKVIIMHAEGWSIRELSRRFHLGRNTIRRILRGHTSRRDQGHDILTKPAVRLSKLDVYAPLIKETLEKYPTITGLRVYEKLKDAGYTGGITIVREQLRKLGAVKREPVIRFERGPGRQAQMDWSPYTIPFRTGKATVQCFSYILGFSRRQYVDFTLRRDFYSLIRRHEDAFRYYNGVPRECLYDNEKTIVLRWEAGKPVFNPAFVSFITHYHCKPVACRPGHPETKGKIEAPFKYIESNLLGGREFEDLEDLRRVAEWWLKEKSDLHVHRTTGKPPLELFEEEHLQPLPAHPYDTSEVALRVCDAEGFVAFETNRYSVPSDYIADILTIKAMEHEILIYSPEIDLVARHERLPAGQGRKVENPDHFATEMRALRPGAGEGCLHRPGRSGGGVFERACRYAPEELRLPRAIHPPDERALRKRRHPRRRRARPQVSRLRRPRSDEDPESESRTPHARIREKREGPKGPREGIAKDRAAVPQ